MNISYNELKVRLAHGSELHFFYMDKQYSISHNKGGWYLTEVNNPEYQTFSTSDDLLVCAAIKGKRIEDIWDSVIIDVIF